MGIVILLVIAPLLRLTASKRLRQLSAVPVPPLTQPSESTPIRVLISHFQDGDRCARTIDWAIKQAKHPKRVHFSIMQAIRDGVDTDCMKIFKAQHLPGLCSADTDLGRQNPTCSSDVLSRMQNWSIPLEDGMGAAHQRGLLNELADLGGNSDMCLNIDSHMDFSPQWDEVMLADWGSADNEFAILTTYPMDMCRGCSSKMGYLPYTCGWFLDGGGVPRGQRSTLVQWHSGIKPSLTMNWAAGLSFGRCHADRNVPVDKELHWIFDGEEIHRAVRLWTHGYDLYMPTTGAIRHDYSHAQQKFWSHQNTSSQGEQTRSNQRIFTLLEMPGGFDSIAALGKYTLGTQRTLSQYFEHLGVHGKSNQAKQSLPNDMTGQCGSLKRTPVQDEAKLRESVVPPAHSEANSFIQSWSFMSKLHIEG